MNTSIHSTIQRSFSIILAASLALGLAPTRGVQPAQAAAAHPAMPAAGTDHSTFLPLISKPAQAGEPVTGVIPPNGGSLTATATNGAMLTLAFPAGAVPDPLTVTITPQSAPTDTLADFSLSPAGYLFQADVTLTLVAPAGVTLTPTASLYYNQAGEPVHLPTTVDTAGNSLTASLTGLGLPALGADSQADHLQEAADTSTELIAEAQSQVDARIAEAQVELNAMLAANDFAHALQLQLSIIALLQSFGSASEAQVQAWVTSAGTTACNAYGQAVTHASATTINDFGQFHGLVSPVLEWEAITQQLGVSPCAGQTPYQTVLAAKMTELQAVIQAKLPIAQPPAGASSATVADSGYDQDFANAQPEVQDLSNLERQSFAMLLTTSSDIDTGAQQPLLDQIRNSAYSQCHTSSTPLQKYLGQYLATVKTDLSGTERSSLVEALQKDIQYCASSLYYEGEDGYTHIFGNIGENITGGPLGGGATPGSQTISADARTPVKRNLILLGVIQPLQCPDGNVGDNQISLIFNGHTLWTGPAPTPTDFPYNIYSVSYLKDMVQQAGGDPATATNGTLQVQRISPACGGAYGPSPYPLFTINFTFGGCQPPTGASYCAEKQSYSPGRVLPDDGKIYSYCRTGGEITKWENGVFTTLGECNSGDYPDIVNDLGHVLGSSTDINGDVYLWVLKDGVRQEIHLPSGHQFFLPGNGSLIAFNNLDQVAWSDWVSYYDASQNLIQKWHIFKWENGVISDLGGFPSSDPYGGQAWVMGVMGINNLGQIVGQANYFDSSNPPQYHYSAAFLWSNGNWSNIYESELFKSYGIAINDLGHVLINSLNSNDTSLVLWSSSDAIHIQPPAGCSSLYDASDQLNNSDVFVGSMVCGSSIVAFIWQNGQVMDLNSLVKLPEGVTLIDVLSLNQDGIMLAEGSDHQNYLLYPAGLPTP